MPYTVVENIPTAGACTYWKLGSPIKLADLHDAWARQGLLPGDLPKPVGDQVAFGRAVAEQQTSRAKGGRRRSVTTLGRGAWAVVEETLTPQSADEKTGSGALSYRTLVHATTQKIERVEATAQESDGLLLSIHAAYDRQQGQLDANDVSGWLIKLANKLDAVSLRDSGGIYFIPRKNVDVWNKIALAVQAASTYKVFRLPAMKNEEAVEAILDAITVEAEAAARAMEDELTKTGDEALGGRALKSRADSCSALLTKVAGYEELLGVKLQAISERVMSLKANIVAASLAGEEVAA